MTHEEIKKLGFLARIEVSQEEIVRFAGDMDNILNFIQQIESVDISNVATSYRFKNITREDNDPYEKGQFTQDLLREAPETLDSFIKVKKIL